MKHWEAVELHDQAAWLWTQVYHSLAVIKREKNPRTYLMIAKIKLIYLKHLSAICTPQMKK